MLEQSLHCLAGANDGLQSGGETGVNMETKTRFAVHQADLQGGKRRSQTVLILPNWKFSEIT